MATFPKLDGLKQGRVKKTVFQKIVHIVGNLTFAEFGVVILAGTMCLHACANNDLPYVHHTYANFCQFNTQLHLDEAAMIDNAHACIKEVLAKR